MKAVGAAFLAIGLAVTPEIARAGESAAPFAGAYVGVNAGGAFGSSHHKTDPGCPPAAANAVFCGAAPDASAVNGTAVGGSGSGDFSSTGFTGGIQAGYNKRKDDIVFGVEADFGLMDLGKSESAAGTFPFAFLGTSYALEQTMSTDWLATLRGRLGRAVMPKLLLYVTGGVAFTDFKFTSRYSDNAVDITFPGGTGYGSESGIRAGWTLGAGGEWQLDDLWSVKAEYLYTDFGSMSFDVPTSNTPAFTQTMRVEADLRTHILRVGLNYRF
ncbi:MAG: outer membrane protein [Alphaproteobacteria bacterium]